MEPKLNNSNVNFLTNNNNNNGFSTVNRLLTFSTKNEYSSTTTPRSHSLYGGMYRYDDDSSDDAYSVFKNYYVKRSTHFPELENYYSTPARVKMSTSIIGRRSSSTEREENHDSYSSVLREKMPNNTLYNYNEESWLYNPVTTISPDVYHNNKTIIKSTLFSNNNPNGVHEKAIASNRHRKVSESEKDKMTLNNKHDEFSLKRRFRTRSESEPNNISNVVKYWSSNVMDSFDSNRGNEINKNIKIDRPPQPEQLTPIIFNSLDISSTNNSKLPPTNPPSSIERRRELSSRLIAYNRDTNIVNTDSPKKSNRMRSRSVLNSPKIHGTARRCKTKSPSPTFKGNSFSPVSPFRKAKSATPPPRLLLSKKIESSTLNKKKIEQKRLIHRKPEMLGTTDTEEEDDDDIADDDDDDDIKNDGNDIGNLSSDSEENSYKKSIAYYTEKISTPLSLDSPTVPPSKPSSLFTPSLFPNVPPYLAFSTHTEKGPPIPAELQKILKWKLTSVMPRVVRHILINSGFRLLKKTNDWMGTWGRHMKSPCFKAIRPYQKINHLPGSFKIGRKDSCWKNLQKQMIRHGKQEFGFMPKTYVIPQDLKLLRRAWPKYTQKNVKWIIKPPASARGTGIKVISRWTQIPKRKPVIVQRYIERPLLINGSKFDLRLYVLVTSINPLRVYMYHDGLVRFASVRYSDRNDTLYDRCMHLTNYSINKFSSNYSKNADVNACHGHKWTLKSLWTYFNTRGVNTNHLWAALRNLVLRTVLAGESAINAMLKLNVESKYSCFELFGFDVLLDSELVPWLLEVNISPSLHSDLPLDIHVKAPLVQAVLNTALYHVPPKLTLEQQKAISAKQGLRGPLCYDKRLYVTYLSKEEKQKHQHYTGPEIQSRSEYVSGILDNLTSDDLRCLITSEDELSRCSPLERVFPTQSTFKYLKYTESPRYYNRLLDAWEYRYGSNREAGIEFLQKLCEAKLHLIVPPPPVKRDSSSKTNICGSENRMDNKESNKINETAATIDSKTTAATKNSTKLFKNINETIDDFETSSSSSSSITATGTRTGNETTMPVEKMINDNSRITTIKEDIMIEREEEYNTTIDDFSIEKLENFQLFREQLENLPETNSNNIRSPLVIKSIISYNGSSNSSSSSLTNSNKNFSDNMPQKIMESIEISTEFFIPKEIH